MFTYRIMLYLACIYLFEDNKWCMPEIKFSPFQSCAQKEMLEVKNAMKPQNH